MNKDSLIVKLMREKGWSLAEAEEFVADMPDEPAPRAIQDGVLQRARQEWEAGDSVQVRKEGLEVAGRFIVAQRGANGLTATQQAGIDRGKSLCPNCHEPEDAHVPGCLRDKKNGFEKKDRLKAITKGTLSPAS